MLRHELSESQFQKIAHLLPCRYGSVGVNAKINRTFLNELFWLFKTGAPWRDLSERYGCCKNTHRRFSRW
ncbi:MAG: transposase [Candidatus Cardinium sp.]